MKIQHFVTLLISSILIYGCDLSGVRNTNDSEIDDALYDSIVNLRNLADTLNLNKSVTLKSDSIQGVPNEMVFQNSNGLRIEWETKKQENAILLNDVVMVNYETRVATGSVFDSNKELGKPVPLKTNIGMMVKGLEEALLHMHIGDVGRIMIPSKLAYGENGYKPHVPPNASIIVEIEIIEKIEPIKLPEGVQVYKWETVKQGQNPIKDQTISFDYFAYVMGKNAKLYDNSYQSQAPFNFKFENANVVDGLHQGMSVMKAGENAFIEIPSRLAYGKSGMQNIVPPNSDIVYDVRVLTIE